MPTDKQYLIQWKEFAEGIRNSTPIDATESTTSIEKRKKRLEANPEEWFKYYFPKYASSPPAQFHKDATKRIIANPEWIEVRNWSRDLAKSTRTMMEILYLALTGKKSNTLIISNSYDNAERLLQPYKINLEVNNRIIQDYGQQENHGSWEAGEFITTKGAAFRALGAGQSPRGTRNEAIRPDVIIFDDLDTDEDCRNADIVDQHWSWVQEAVIPTRSTNNPLLVIWCGNIIAEDCCVVRAAQFADEVDKRNIDDNEGKSTWPEKVTQEMIERLKKTMSTAAFEKEYRNNPMPVGKTFPEITWGKCPPLEQLEFVVVYGDPGTSTKDKPGAKSTNGTSRKAVWIVGRVGTRYYVYYGFLDVRPVSVFVDWYYDCRDYIADRCTAYYIAENNSLQNPFFIEAILPQVYNSERAKTSVLPIIGDARDKKEKGFRIEATLEPVNKRGDLIFNEDEKQNPHMMRLVDQFKAFKANSKSIDGPDCIEGAVFIIDVKFYNNQKPVTTIPLKRNKHKAL